MWTFVCFGFLKAAVGYYDNVLFSWHYPPVPFLGENVMSISGGVSDPASRLPVSWVVVLKLFFDHLFPILSFASLPAQVSFIYRLFTVASDNVFYPEKIWVLFFLWNNFHTLIASFLMMKFLEMSNILTTASSSSSFCLLQIVLPNKLTVRMRLAFKEFTGKCSQDKCMWRKVGRREVSQGRS